MGIPSTSKDWFGHISYASVYYKLEDLQAKELGTECCLSNEKDGSVIMYCRYDDTAYSLQSLNYQQRSLTLPKMCKVHVWKQLYRLKYQDLQNYHTAPKYNYPYNFHHLIPDKPPVLIFNLINVVVFMHDYCNYIWGNFHFLMSRINLSGPVCAAVE